MPKLTAYLLYKHIATLFEADKIVIRINLLCVLGVYGQMMVASFFITTWFIRLRRPKLLYIVLKPIYTMAF